MTVILRREPSKSAFTRVFDALWRASKDARPRHCRFLAAQRQPGRRASKAARGHLRGDGLSKSFSATIDIRVRDAAGINPSGSWRRDLA